MSLAPKEHPEGCQCARCNPGNDARLQSIAINGEKWCELIHKSKSLPVDVIRTIERLHGVLVMKGYPAAARRAEALHQAAQAARKAKGE